MDAFVPLRESSRSYRRLRPLIASFSCLYCSTPRGVCQVRRGLRVPPPVPEVSHLTLVTYCAKTTGDHGITHPLQNASLSLLLCLFVVCLVSCCYEFYLCMYRTCTFIAHNAHLGACVACYVIRALWRPCSVFRRRCPLMHAFVTLRHSLTLHAPLFAFVSRGVV